MRCTVFEKKKKIILAFLEQCWGIYSTNLRENALKGMCHELKFILFWRKNEEIFNTNAVYDLKALYNQFAAGIVAFLWLKYFV